MKPAHQTCPQCGGTLRVALVGYTQGEITREAWLTCKPCGYFQTAARSAAELREAATNRISEHLVKELLREDQRKGKPGSSSSSGKVRKRKVTRLRPEQDDAPCWGDEEGEQERINTKAATVRLRVSLGHKSYLVRVARDRGTTMSELIREAIQEYLTEQVEEDARLIKEILDEGWS